MCDFAILLLKIVKSHPFQKWSRVSPQYSITKPKCTNSFIIHVAKGFGWWFADFSSIFMYYQWILKAGGMKSRKRTFYALVNLYKDLVSDHLVLHSKMWLLWPKAQSTIWDLTPSPQHQSLDNCNLLPIKTIFDLPDIKWNLTNSAFRIILGILGNDVWFWCCIQKERFFCIITYQMYVIGCNGIYNYKGLIFLWKLYHRHCIVDIDKNGLGGIYCFVLHKNVLVTFYMPNYYLWIQK